MHQCQRIAKCLLTQYILYCELEDVLFSKGTFTVQTSQYWLVVEHLPHPSLLSIIFTHVVFTCFSSSSSHANTIICLTHCNLSWIFFMIWFDVWAKILNNAATVLQTKSYTPIPTFWFLEKTALRNNRVSGTAVL